MAVPGSMALRSVLMASVMMMAGAANAADLATASRITAVTVYPAGATVTRVAAVKVEAGEHVLTLTGLPDGIDARSVQVVATGPSGLAITAIEVRRVDPGPPPPDALSAAEAQIRALTDERATWDDAIEAAKAKQAFLARVAAPGAREGAAPTGLADLRDWAAFIEAGTREAADARRAALTRQRAIDEEIERIRKTLDRDPATNVPRTAVRLGLSAAAAGEATFKVTYRVDNATWVPSYEARLATRDASLTFASRALVSQATGEDWTDVEMALSTTNPAQGASAPELDSLIVRLRPPEPPVAKRALPAPMAMAPASEAVMLEGSADAAPAPELGATVDASGFDVVYRLPTRASVETGVGQRSVSIDTKTLPVALTWRTVPTIDTNAYLTATLKNGSEGPWLPGDVNLVRDGQFIGTQPLAVVGPGAEAKLGFGADDRVEVKHQIARAADGKTGILTTSTTRTESTITTIVNRRDTPISVTVEDRLPVSEADVITVELLSKSNPPTTSNLDGKRGVVSWTFDLGAGATKTLPFEWRATWPADKPVMWSDGR